MFFLAPGDSRYLGRLCKFGTCPQGKPECSVPGCGATSLLRQYEDFVFFPDALSPDKAVVLYERGKGVVSLAVDLPRQIAGAKAAK
jgi:hypothetical protein